MSSQNELVSKTGFRFQKKHFLIIGLLILSFSISFLLRYQPAEFGFELNEFDPFFNYRATDYLLQNGLDDYLNWQDDKSWYPDGRDVSKNSQVMLHLTTALAYSVFGFGNSLYDFTILFPIIIGSLTTVVIFALVRQISGTMAGLFSAFLFSVSLPVLVRGSLGWFKSEPLGIFYALIGIYLLLSGLKSESKKVSVIKLASSGIVISLSLSAWGGNQFFIIPIGLFFLSIPFLRKDHNFLLWSIPLFTLSTILSSFAFERLGSQFSIGLGGLAIILPTIFVIACIFVQKKSSPDTKLRNGLFLLAGLIILGSIFLVVLSESNLITLPSHRYLNALNPFLTTTDPLVDSISEHATTTIQQSFLFHSIWMIFAGIGIWLILQNKEKLKEHSRPEMLSFALIFGLTGVYASSTFVRLELFASLSLIILASIGLSIMSRYFLKLTGTTTNRIIKFSFISGIIILLIIPLVYPEQNWTSANKIPNTILNGGTGYRVSTSDWLDAMEWLKNNTPQDAVIASWWDYGYWITTLSERTTLIDNATISTSKIENIAKAFLSTPEIGSEMLTDTGADYVLVFVAGELLDANSDTQYYLIQGGGDESKKQWIMRIAGEKLSKHLHSDGISGTDHFWENTLLGKMIPFQPVLYADFANNLQTEEFKQGFIPVYVKDVKFPTDGDGPLRLVYASPSFFDEKPGPLIGVFIYEIMS